MAMNFKSLLPHLIAVLTFVIISCAYFMPQFQGQILQQSDSISFEGMAKEIKDYNANADDDALWTNSMFGGMPAYQIYSPGGNNVTRYLQKIMSFGIPRPAGIFIFGLICSYLLLVVFGVNAWLSLFLAFGMAFATNNLILLEAGHMTKVTSLMSIPLVVGGVVLAYRKNVYLGGAFFTLGMMLNLKANHYQMTFYLGLCLIIFVIIALINAIRKGKIMDFVKPSAILILGLILALGTSASKLMTTYEYSKDTMRGDPILTKNIDKTSSSGVDGLAWDYAMQWSNGGKDLLSTFIPMAVGGSSGESVSPKSDLGKKLRLRKSEKLPIYWGDLPFTSGPSYFGAVIFFLFLLGALIYPGPVKWWLVSAVGLTMLLSLGKNFEFFNRLFFEYFPFYNKFRTPNSVLSVTSFILPVLSGLAVSHLLYVKDKKSLIIPLLSATGIIGGISLLMVLIGGSIFDFSSMSDARLAQQGFPVELLEDYRASVLRGSSLRTLFFILSTAGLIYFYLLDKIKPIILILGIGILSLVDVMGVNLKYVNSDSFVSDRQYRQFFNPRPVDKQILEDSDKHYRVLDLTVNTFNSSQSSYHHKTIGGYHAAKLQRYQDIIDYHISKNNQNVLDMLNTKYIISNSNGDQPGARINPSALGNAWFVNSVRFVPTADEEIAMLSTFDPRGEAIVHEEFRSQIGSESFTKSGTINLTSYSPNVLKYSSQSDSDQLAVFSEVWYGPNKGWNLYIDSQKVPLLRANYILRAAKIPSGNHVIEMRFEPETYARGNSIALISSILSLVLIAGGFFLYWRKQQQV